jgi:hypothetical protein
MAKMKKASRPELISGGYSSIPWTVQDSVSFMGASDKAKALLFALMRQHNGHNNGHLHLAKKWLYNHGWTCDENNRKSCHELIERGLIIQTKWGGLNMGAHYFALTWHNISNYEGLDITAKGYNKGAYSLCTLPPTPRRKQPNKKQIVHHDYRDSASSTIETAGLSSGSTTELIKPVLATLTGSTTENNVVIPLPPVKSIKPIKRIVGIKGKSGILKTSQSQIASAAASL